MSRPEMPRETSADARWRQPSAVRSMGGTGEIEDKLSPPVDRALHALGFEFIRITPREVVGRLAVTDMCCQPFGRLNGGVSALMAESTASIGGYVSSGYRRVAGVELSINHVKPAHLGDLVQVRATPIQLGRKIQVWEVQISQLASDCKDLVSTARVTVLTNLPTPKNMKSYEEGIKKYAKL